MKILTDVILTTPHKICDPKYNKEEHVCDYYASKLAEQLKNILNQDEKNKYSKNIYLIEGDINRRTIDLNRLPSRETNFRHDIRKLIYQLLIDTLQRNDANLLNQIYLIDIHSFPKNSDSFLTIRGEEMDIVILCDSLKYFRLIDELRTMLKENGLKAIIYVGIKNDIMDEAIEIENKYNLNKYNINIINFLVEIKESLSESDVVKTAKVINEWINVANNYIHKK